MSELTAEQLRALDRRVAAEVMGWGDFWEGDGLLFGASPLDGLEDDRQEVPHYSHSMSAAWEVVEHLLTREGVQIGLIPIGWNGGWECRRMDPAGQDRVVGAETAPLAICRLALKIAEHRLNTAPPPRTGP